MLLQVSELAGLRFWGQNLLFEQGIVACGGVLHIICFAAANWRLAVGHLGGTAWHCLSLLSRVMSVNAHGLILLG
jgi:hypothetical protein